jgi:riboflavin biosynthesis protein ribF
MVYWLDRVRDMIKFDSVEELVDQLQKDEEIARNWKDGDSVIQGAQV